ncbi:Zn-dependent protease [Clostridia bacterium]|nr:Zn-dependent protease [Clostridia bacterium]
MELSPNTYIAKNEHLFQKLLDGLLAKYQFASILAMDSSAKSYRVSRQGIDISGSPLFDSRGFVARIFKDGEFFEYSGSEITENGIPEIIGAITELTDRKTDGLKAFSTLSDFAVPEEEVISFEKSTGAEILPEDLSDEKVIEKLSLIRKQGLGYSDNVLDCMVRVAYQRYGKLYLSKNKNLKQNILWADGMIGCIARAGQEIKQSFGTYSNLGGLEVLNKMEKEAPELAEKVLELLESKPMIPGEYDCICSPAVTGMIVHEAFGHGVEMDMFVKNRALAKDFIGKQVASPLINMRDAAVGVDQTATYFFDDEGTLSTNTLIIEKGILKQGISDLQSAKTLGTVPTGNGRRESFARKPYTRMTNTFFEAGTDKLPDMIASIKDGFLLEHPSSGMEDPKNWGIQCMVTTAREIKDGKLTGKLFSPIVLTGYVPDLLKSITMVSEDVKLSGSGMCGKGHKEWVKVSDGGPYIKARILLG